VRSLFCLLVALAGLGWPVAASTQNKDNASAPALHRFVGDDGLGVSTVRRSDLDTLWGRAEVEKPMGSRHASRGRGEWLLIDYKSRGMLFHTARGSYGQADPLIESAYFTEPFDGCTPQGLCIGMPQNAAMAIISVHYKVTGDYAVSFGNSGRVTGRSYSARNKGWRKTHYMSFAFDEGRLRSMSFQLQPTPLVEWRTVRNVIAWAIIIAIVVVASRLLRPYKRQLEPLVKAAKVGFVLYVVTSVVLGLVVLYALFGGK
jgi:hypothetical protein